MHVPVMSYLQPPIKAWNLCGKGYVKSIDLSCLEKVTKLHTHNGNLNIQNISILVLLDYRVFLNDIFINISKWRKSSKGKSTWETVTKTSSDTVTCMAELMRHGAGNGYRTFSLTPCSVQDQPKAPLFQPLLDDERAHHFLK